MGFDGATTSTAGASTLTGSAATYIRRAPDGRLLSRKWWLSRTWEIGRDGPAANG